MRNLFLLTGIFLLMTGNLFSQITNTFTINDHSGQDALVDSDPSYPNYGKFNLNMAAAWTTSGNFFIVRDLLDFDITSIPAGATITSAYLELKFATNGLFGGTQYGQNSCYISRINQPWVDTLVNWANKPTTSSLHVVSVPASATYNQSYNIDVTQLVQDMVLLPSSSYGFQIALQNETAYAAVTFASGDHANAQLHPKLTVTYVDCQLPNAGFTANIQNTQVSFTSMAANALSWNWNFGDGNLSTLQNPVNTYQSSGTYYVCLSVTDTCGTATYCDSVIICPLPDPQFTWVQNGMTYNFIDQSLLASQWLWDFGDGYFSTNQNPSHTFANYGTYTVTEKVTNSCGVESISKQLGITAGIDQQQAQMDLVIGPNPASGFVYICSGKTGRCEVEVYLADGRLKEIKSFAVLPGQRYALNIEQYTKGIYFFKAKLDGKTISTKVAVN